MAGLGTTTAKRDFIVKISGVAHAFATFTGGNKTRTVTEAWNGGAKNPDLIPGPAMNEEITCSAPYNPKRDEPIIARFRREIQQGKTYTVTKTPVDADGVVAAKGRVFSGCVLVSITEPDSDAGSSDAARYELKFRPQADS